MKNYLRIKNKPWNLAELKEGIKMFWKTLIPKMCSKYIAYLQKVMPDVMKANRAPSGH